MTDLTPEALADLRRTFNDDALERLVRSEMAYYSTHGHYVPALARLLLAEKAEAKAALDAERARAEASEQRLANELLEAVTRAADLKARNRNLIDALEKAEERLCAIYELAGSGEARDALRAAVLEEPQ